MTEQEEKLLNDLLAIVGAWRKGMISSGGCLPAIQDTIKRAGYVKLANDQSLPENPYIGHEDHSTGGRFYLPLGRVIEGEFVSYENLEPYSLAQQDMLNMGFRKVIGVDADSPT